MRSLYVAYVRRGKLRTTSLMRLILIRAKKDKKSAYSEKKRKEFQWTK